MILHDPAVFPEPHEFRPERFLIKDGQLNPDVLDPTIACFGFGRRSVEASTFECAYTHAYLAVVIAQDVSRSCVCGGFILQRRLQRPTYIRYLSCA